VLFRRDGKNVGELEMRNDSEQHYGEVHFDMNREPCLTLLDAVSFDKQDWSPEVQLYGHTARILEPMVGNAAMHINPYKEQPNLFITFVYNLAGPDNSQVRARPNLPSQPNLGRGRR